MLTSDDNPFAPPSSWPQPAPVTAARSRWRDDVPRAVLVVVWSVLLGAPAGLLWSALSPRLQFTVADDGLHTPDLEGSKAFIGADGSFLLVMLAAGLLCGVIAWLVARRSGPWTVVALAVGGVLAGVVAARVGLQPGAQHALEALRPGTSIRGDVSLFLGAHTHGKGFHLRASWTVLGWPVAALVSFLGLAFVRPEDFD